MSKHTPGPWQLDPRPEDIINGTEAYGVRESEDHAPLAVVYADAPESKANARLIAAAPEMLETLELARKALYSNNLQRIKGTYEVIERIIAKATGGGR